MKKSTMMIAHGDRSICELVNDFSEPDLDGIGSPGTHKSRVSSPTPGINDQKELFDRDNPPGLKGFRKMQPREGEAARAFVEHKKA